MTKMKEYILFLVSTVSEYKTIVNLSQVVSTNVSCVTMKSFLRLDL